MSALRSLSDWTFACPICHSPLAPTGDDARCDRCDRAYACSRRIWRFLPEERLAQYGRFLREYQIVREDQGWGRPDATYYLALPHVSPDDPQRAIWRRRSESCRVLFAKVVEPMAARLGRPLRILDLGAGNCWLAYRLAEMGHLVAAIDLSVDMTDGLGAHVWYHVVPRDAQLGPGGHPDGARQARREMPHSATEGGRPPRRYAPFTPIQADFDHLPLPDQGAGQPVSGMPRDAGPQTASAGPIDLAVFNASLHYSMDCRATLREALRVLSPDGSLVVMDSPVYRRAGSGEQMVRER
ncbi:MAG: class I SAM-dependent methyltransferase, partial [Chloroflexi bacterium]|nr:class I SAM-dependent methyltransferase [Chloroflexota bacterium]